MACKIDSRAAIAPGAQLGTNVEIGPFAVVDENVQIGDGCRIGPHVHLTGWTTIGANTSIHAGAVIGDEPQDLHYNGEKSFTVIGDNCTIREYVTIHRGTEEGSATRVGNNVLLMALCHLGHNCQIEDDVVIANSTLLAGRVEVGRHAFISGACAIHQFVHIGRLAMVGGGNAFGQDVPPFCMLQLGCIHGPNMIGLRRAGWDEQLRDDVREAIKIYFFGGLNTPNALAEIRAKVTMHPEIEEFISFIEKTKRGVMRGHLSKGRTE
ncbi:MAG: acyl-ACP--UDP-N-acetylglucosamine O-acyltransferase [Victivallales bacterium]|nr:acyl-ACP--UDP-N-acetylglucosamine O-acyltransferase [Victivallales bacterium]